MVVVSLRIKTARGGGGRGEIIANQAVGEDQNKLFGVSSMTTIVVLCTNKMLTVEQTKN